MRASRVGGHLGLLSTRLVRGSSNVQVWKRASRIRSGSGQAGCVLV